ncbi:E3 ubiquitin-protein ligase FANCL-like [Diadema setosum]|uniref:E3 ubiquitin-protein ligase FANCL-like n=1 Tax=Diadema setosum TaxID=31175 RepID=UPI003B3B4D1F
MSRGDVWHVLIPQNLDRTVWMCIIKVQGEEHQIHLELPLDKCLHGARVWGDWRLERHLRKHRKMIQSRLKSATDPENFIRELCSLLEASKKKGCKTGMPLLKLADDSALYSRIVQEVGDIGWERVSDIDADFKRLELLSKEISGTTHTIKIQLHQQYPSVAPTCCTNLPGDFELHWNHKCTLRDILNQFEGCLKQYQPFWDEMTEIDANAWILEPEKPGPADVHRRIALGNNSSLQITVDPFHPHMLPQCRFLGAEHVIGPLRHHLNVNLLTWNSSASLLANLRSVLDVDFPLPSSSQQQDFTEECGICYSYRLDSIIPDQVCDNPQCNKPFHQTCLHEWLCSLPTSRQNMTGLGFNTLYGECPYCSKPISMKKLDKR